MPSAGRPARAAEPRPRPGRRPARPLARLRPARAAATRGRCQRLKLTNMRDLLAYKQAEGAGEG